MSQRDSARWEARGQSRIGSLWEHRVNGGFRIACTYPEVLLQKTSPRIGDSRHTMPQIKDGYSVDIQ
ncbi:hypothetical protein [Scytonema sp. PCC 10023]|uniref:hypothetical protein n=1 Tax=Scytonema sp. PCC 10023 TaxID=1680591 RepID=UPI0039C6C4EB